jgi:hypothetical protein
MDCVQEDNWEVTLPKGLRQCRNLWSDTTLECLLVQRGEDAVLALNQSALAFIDEQRKALSRLETPGHLCHTIDFQSAVRGGRDQSVAR